MHKNSSDEVLDFERKIIKNAFHKSQTQNSVKEKALFPTIGNHGNGAPDRETVLLERALF